MVFVYLVLLTAAGRVRSVEEEETPAQTEARANATMKLNMERFNKIWGKFKQFFII